MAEDITQFLTAGTAEQLSRPKPGAILGPEELAELQAFVGGGAAEEKDKRTVYLKKQPGTVAHIKNPVTGRWIRVFGSAYNLLMKSKDAPDPKKIKVFYLRPFTPAPVVTWDEGKLNEMLTDRTIFFEKHGVNREQVGNGRGIKTRGWNAIFPKGDPARRALYKTCGAECFLLPGPTPDSHHGYPICASLGATSKDCQADCRGIQAAYGRAKQWKQPSVAQLSKKLQQTLGCP